uniref:Uncharacterized protein n=1 Tax=Avena sativa TaxID=4498 RepID=A0ACD5V2D5_AVESA
MSGTDKDKSADSSIDKMYEIFSKLLEQQQHKLVPEAVKYALDPNPVRLSDPGNYVSWKRHAQLILNSHGYEHLLADDEENVKSGDTSARQINDRVLVWLLGSMEPIVRQQIEIMTTVFEVWAALEKQFSGKSNKMQATRIIGELTHLNQGTQSVTEYAGEVKRLYRDLHYYHPFNPVDKNDLAIHHEWFESIVAKLFLDGLNQEFNLQRQIIFSETVWPGLDIISSVLEEETRLSQSKEGNPKGGEDRAALSMRPRHVARPFNKLEKSNCKRNGHTKDTCFELHGFPSWWDKGRSRSGGVQAAIKRQANHITSVQDSPVVDARALEEFNSKSRLSEGTSSSQGPSKAESSVLATTSQGKECHQAYTTTSQSKPWIIDTGATNHMTEASELFSTYTPCSGKDKVRVADGSMAPIVGRGSIRCTKTLSLSPVLHVPKFPVNLLSVSSLNKSRNCRSWFDPTCCAFQELGTGRLLGTGTEHNGLYYLDDGSDEVVLTSCFSSSQELLLHHRRLGHLSFAVLPRLYPTLFKSCPKELLVCDACEMAKHTRGTYPGVGLKSSKPFEIIHSDVWDPVRFSLS